MSAVESLISFAFHTRLSFLGYHPPTTLLDVFPLNDTMSDLGLTASVTHLPNSRVSHCNELLLLQHHPEIAESMSPEKSYPALL